MIQIFTKNILTNAVLLNINPNFVQEFYQGRKRIITSPSPVAPHAPTSSSAYAAAPTIGPSPTRPGILWLAPLVEVPAAIRPLWPITKRARPHPSLRK
jgi:hypothetical protein